MQLAIRTKWLAAQKAPMAFLTSQPKAFFFAFFGNVANSGFYPRQHSPLAFWKQLNTPSGITFYWMQPERIALALILLGTVFLAGCGDFRTSLEVKVTDLQGNPIDKANVYSYICGK